MQEIIKKYIVDEENKRIAVQLDMDTFTKIEEALENYGLMQAIKENEGEVPLTTEEAKKYYDSLLSDQ